MTRPSPGAPYDAVVVGGGPAGLTCAIFLARSRRHVVLIDDRHPRNHAAREIHGFIGQHGIAPGELLERGRMEAAHVGAELREGRVTKIARDGDLFELETSTGALRARRVVLAYGVRDTLPDIPDVESYYGTTVHHCPDCDGYECRDRRIGVIGWRKATAGLALKLLQWSDDVVVFTHGREREWDGEQHEQLIAEKIGFEEGRIAALAGENGRVDAAVLNDGRRVPVQHLFFTIRVERSSTLAEDLGCATVPDKPDVVVDQHRRTTVEGVWAVGDLVGGSDLAITAAADGAVAAIDINNSLLPKSRVV
jgi:thioredoxin reductase